MLKKSDRALNFCIGVEDLNDTLILLLDTNKKKTKNMEEKTITILTDEQLFAACGGRTAHKAARHGLSLNGKLERIKKQETDIESNSSKANSLKKSLDLTSKKKKLKTNDEQLQSNETGGYTVATNENVDSVRGSKKRKKERKNANEKEECTISCTKSNENCGTLMFEELKLEKGKKKSRRLSLNSGTSTETVKDHISEDNQLSIISAEGYDKLIPDLVKRKKIKRKFREPLESEIYDEKVVVDHISENSVEITRTLVEKKKLKCKKKTLRA